MSALTPKQRWRRATVAQKALLGISERRLRILHVSGIRDPLGDAVVLAECQSSRGFTAYRITFGRDGWSCTCPALKECWHIRAAALVVPARRGSS